MSTRTESFTLAVSSAPYRTLQPVPPKWDYPCPPGELLLWWWRSAAALEDEYEIAQSRPKGMPLVVILPEPEEVEKFRSLVRRLTRCYPAVVLPPSLGADLSHIVRLLRLPPAELDRLIFDYISRRLRFDSETTAKEVRKVVEAARSVKSVSALSRMLCASRRTVGRHFANAGLPAPSLWLQMCRLLYATVQLQSGEQASVFSVAVRFGYPDGFTMSNQMKRVLGLRPTEVRELVGWEWIVERWLLEQSRRGRIDLDRYGEDLFN